MTLKGGFAMKMLRNKRMSKNPIPLMRRFFITSLYDSFFYRKTRRYELLGVSDNAAWRMKTKRF